MHVDRTSQLETNNYLLHFKTHLFHLKTHFEQIVQTADWAISEHELCCCIAAARKGKKRREDISKGSWGIFVKDLRDDGVAPTTGKGRQPSLNVLTEVIMVVNNTLGKYAAFRGLLIKVCHTVRGQAWQEFESSVFSFCLSFFFFSFF